MAWPSHDGPGRSRIHAAAFKYLTPASHGGAPRAYALLSLGLSWPPPLLAGLAAEDPPERRSSEELAA